MRQLYWCDRCYKDIVDENENFKRIYFSCYSNQQWASHLKSKKHTKFCEKVENDSEKVLCKYCNKNFTKEGYEIHKERNGKLWELKKGGGFKNLTCNNYFTKGKRYESFSDYCLGTDSNRPKLKRTKVGKISPITNCVRPPNKNNTKQTLAQPQVITSSPVLEDNDIINCNICNKVYCNDSNYTDNELKEKFNMDMCNCENDKPIKEVKNEELSWESKNDGLKMTIEEIENTEKPTYTDHCYDCNKGIIDYNLTKNIYIKWGMDFCECEDSDSDY